MSLNQALKGLPSEALSKLSGELSSRADFLTAEGLPGNENWSQFYRVLSNEMLIGAASRL